LLMRFDCRVNSYFYRCRGEPLFAVSRPSNWRLSTFLIKPFFFKSPPKPRYWFLDNINFLLYFPSLSFLHLTNHLNHARASFSALST
jgi:hypothetical protein